MLPGRAKVAGWDFHPLENAALARRTPTVAIRESQQRPQANRENMKDLFLMVKTQSLIVAIVDRDEACRLTLLKCIEPFLVHRVSET